MAGEPASQIHLAFAVALDAELHVKVLSPNAIHGFNRPMAFLACHFFSDVALVVEEDVFG